MSSTGYLSGREGAELVTVFMYDKAGARDDVGLDGFLVTPLKYFKDGVLLKVICFAFSFLMVDPFIALNARVCPRKAIMMFSNNGLLWDRLFTEFMFGAFWWIFNLEQAKEFEDFLDCIRATCNSVVLLKQFSTS